MPRMSIGGLRLGSLGARCVFGAQPCSYALAGCRERILHGLGEHAHERIIPICCTVSWTQDFHGIVMRSRCDDTKLGSKRNPEGTFVGAPAVIGAALHTRAT